MDAIIFSTADWNNPIWTNKQHTACGLAKLGIRVMYVESLGLRTPGINTRDCLRILRRLKAWLKGPVLVRENIWVLSPIVIPIQRDNSLVKKLNDSILRLTINKHSKKLKFDAPMIWTYHPYAIDVIKELGYKKLIYPCVDDLSVVPGVDTLSFKKKEYELLLQVDHVFTTSEKLKKACMKFTDNVSYFPNVTDFKHFSLPTNIAPIRELLADIPKPRICYHGVLSDYKIDFNLIKTIIHARPDWNWIFIGEEREGQRSKVILELRSCPNVHFLGAKKYTELPNYLAEMDLGVLPLLRNEYTESMFPMKYFEYLAAGLPVVSTDVAFTNQVCEGMIKTRDAVEFMDGISQQLKRGRLTFEESKQLVGENTWEKRLKKMMYIITRSVHA